MVSKIKKLIIPIVIAMVLLSLFSGVVLSQGASNVVFVGRVGFDLDHIEQDTNYLDAFYDYWVLNFDKDVIVMLLGVYIFDLFEYTAAGEPIDIVTFANNNPAVVHECAFVWDGVGEVPAPADVISVKPVGSIPVALGTEYEDISFPEEVEVEVQSVDANDPIQMFVDVVWSAAEDAVPPYNAEAPDTYAFTGSLLLPDHICNPMGLFATVDVELGSLSASVSDLYRDDVDVEEGVRKLFHFEPGEGDPGGVYNLELSMSKVNAVFGDISGYQLKLLVDGVVVIGDTGAGLPGDLTDVFIIETDYAVLPAIQEGNQTEPITINPQTLAEGTVWLVN